MFKNKNIPLINKAAFTRDQNWIIKLFRTLAAYKQISRVHEYKSAYGSNENI